MLIAKYIRRPQTSFVPKLGGIQAVTHNNPVGLVVAEIVDGKINLGWATCHEASTGKHYISIPQANGRTAYVRRNHFNKKKAMLIARGRAKNGSNSNPPAYFQPYMAEVYQRAERAQQTTVISSANKEII